MEILRGLLVVVEALVGLLVIGIVLLQKSREQGMGLAFGSGFGESIFGSRAGNVLTRGTVWLGAAFLINTVFLAVLFAGRERSLMEKAEGARGEAPAATAPQTPGPQPGSPASGAAPTAMPEAPAGGSPTVPVTVPVSPAVPPTPDAAPASPVPAPAPPPAAPAPATPPVPAP